MKYRKKPVVIDAVKWNGFNLSEIKEFLGDSAQYEKQEHFYNLRDGSPFTPPWIEITIHTLEGDMCASYGDYIIRGVSGEFYPCKPDVFVKTYEPVEIIEDFGA